MTGLAGESKGIAFTNWLVNKAAGVLERKSSRRGFLIGSAMAGSAVAVAGCLPAIKPGSPYTHITDCAGGLCTDGYTEFCCTINDGFNTCPTGSFAGGWWRADYSSFCNGTRYYIDCMQNCCGPNLGNGFCAGCSECRCAGGCNTRRVYCNYFRYGQCHQEIGITGPIACRVVTCTPPYKDASMACTTVLAVDNSTAEHAAAVPCVRKTVSLASAANGAVVNPGRIAVFSRFSDSFIWTQQWDGAGWTGWAKVPPAVISGLSSASDATGLYVVGRGVDNQVRYNRLSNGGWTGEGILGGIVPASDPKLVAEGGNVHVFIRASDHSVRHGTFTSGSWSGWTNLGGSSLSNIAATASNWGLFIFIRDSDYGLSVNRLNGGNWSGWSSLGGSLLGDPAAAADSSSVYVFAQQAGRQIWYRGFLNGSWGGWSNLGGDVSSDPVATVAPDGVYVFVRGSDTGAYLNRLSNFAWSGFKQLWGSFDSNIDAVGDSSGVYAFGRGSDGALWTGRHANGAWSGWSSLGGSIAPLDGVS
jgi:hypothetical protein